MRSVFLISALVLHMSWCYAFPGHDAYGPWSSFFDDDMPDFVDGFKEIAPLDIKVDGQSDNESKPGATGSSYSSVSSSFTTVDSDGKVHKTGETVINDNGKITKYKY